MKGTWIAADGMVKLCDSMGAAQKYANHMNRETRSKKYSAQGYVVFRAGRILVSQGKKTGNVYLHPHTYKEL